MILDDKGRGHHNGSQQYVSGMNTLSWAPHFVMPNVCTTLWEVYRRTYMADWDIGDMFIKSMLI